MPRLLHCLLLLCWLAPPASAAVLEIDVLHSNRAAELQPVLAPLAAPEGHVSVYQDQLVVRATPEKLALIRDTLRQLDRPLQNLRISVRRAAQADSRREGVAARGEVDLGQDRPSARLRVEAGRQRTQAQRQQHYAITAQEGSTVFIASGSEVPVLQLATTPAGTIVAGTVHVPVQSGFRVTPRLQPDGYVQLEIEVEQADLGPGRTLRREALGTRLRVPPGSWVPLGSTAFSETVHGNAGRQTQSRTLQAPLEVLVEPLP